MTSAEAALTRRGSAATATATATATHEPRELDILCGKETKARNHKGSKCFRIFVDRYRKRYQEANNKHKRGEITKEMYLTITQANIRFLKFNEELNGWVEISSTEARDKITHALRFAQKRSSRKNKKNVPQRQGSDSTHRSETSATSATSYDWDQLLQTQQHLAGLSLGNMNSSLRASRSSFSSTGTSASLLSKDLSKDSSHSSAHARTTKQRGMGGGGGSSHSKASSTKSSTTARSSKSKSKSNRGGRSSTTKVSFEPSVCSAGLSTIYSASTKDTNTTLESIPLPVDLSSTQHFDMHQSQTSLATEDRPPRMPSRPMDEEAAEDANADSASDQQQQEQTAVAHHDDDEDEDAFDTIMNTTNTGFGEMLDPLLEIDQENMRDSDSHASSTSESENGSDKPSPIQQQYQQQQQPQQRQPMVAPNGDLLPINNNSNNDELPSLEPLSAQLDPIISNDDLLEAVGDELLDGLADMGIDDDPIDHPFSSSNNNNDNSINGPAPALEGQEMISLGGEETPSSVFGMTTTTTGGGWLHHHQHTHNPLHHNHHHHHHVTNNNGTGDYSQLLMQEPLWEWEPRGETNQTGTNTRPNS